MYTVWYVIPIIVCSQKLYLYPFWDLSVVYFYNDLFSKLASLLFNLMKETSEYVKIDSIISIANTYSPKLLKESDPYVSMFISLLWASQMNNGTDLALIVFAVINET